MSKKMKLPFQSKSTESTAASAASAWPWPACVNNPKTLSFRANPDANIYKTRNSAFLDDKSNTAEISAETADWFSSMRDESFPCPSEAFEQPAADESAVVRGLRSDRLFFEPGETNSILEEAKSHGDFPYKGGVALMAMDSMDPCLDFRVSMEEMVEAHGLKDWECLEELLTCYLRVNRKSNHGYVVGAFVDLLLHLALANDNTCSNSAIDEQRSSSSTATHEYSFTSPLSFSSSTYSSISPSLSLMENEDGIIVGKNVNPTSSSSCSSDA